MIEERAVKFFDRMGAKNILWKVGGKPKPYQAYPLVDDIKTQLDQFVRENQTTIGKRDLNQLLLKAMSTINWMIENRNDEQRQNLAELSVSLNEIPKLLETALKRSASSTSHGPALDMERNLEKIFESIKTEVASTDDEHVRHSATLIHSSQSLWPLYDHQSMKMELEAISHVHELNYLYRRHIVQPYQDESIVRDAIYNTKQAVEKLIDYTLSKSSRPALDLTPYQSLLWSFTASSDISTQLERLPILQKEIWSKWNARAWSNSYNDVKVGDDETQTLSGPNRLFQDINAVRILQLLSNWESVPFRARFTKIDQMKTVLDFICGVGANETGDHADWKHCTDLFCETLLCFSKSLTEEQSAALVVLTDKLVSKQSIKVVELGRIVDASQDIRLRNHKETILSIAEIISQSNQDNSFTNAAVRGKVWILTGMLRLLLVQPGQPIDPTRKYTVMVDLLNPNISMISEKMNVYRDIEKFITGGTENAATERFSKDLARLEEDLARVKGKVIQRPNIPFSALFGEIREIVSLLVSHKNNQKLEVMVQNMTSLLATTSVSEDLEQNLQQVLAEEDNWQNNADNRTHRLLDNYVGYEDIIVPFVTCIYQIKYGLRLMSFGTFEHVRDVQGNENQEALLMSTLMRNLLSFPSTNDLSTIVQDVRMLEKILALNFSTMKNPQKRYERFETVAKLLRALLSRAYLLALNHPNDALHSSTEEHVMGTRTNQDVSNVINAIFSLYSNLYRRVDEEVLEKQKEHEERFRYKEQVTVVEAEDDESILREMDAMFPTYIEHYDEFVTKPEGTAAVDPTKPVASKQPATEEKKMLDRVDKELRTTKEAGYLVKVHNELFTDRKITAELDQQARDDMIEQSFSVAGRIMQKVDKQSLLQLESHLPFALYGSHALRQLTKKFEKQLETNEFDIYNEPNIPELTAAFSVLNILVTKINTMLARYENSPTLIQMIQICERIMDLPLTTPLVKVLTGLEVLLGKIFDWEGNLLTKNGSIAEQMYHLGQLVSRWRRMELENYKVIFDIKNREFEAKSYQWWFQFYETLRADAHHENEEKNLEAFFSICDEFMRKTTIGDFKPKLEMLPSFERQIRSESTLAKDEQRLKLADVLYNVYQFYKQFVEKLNTKVEGETKPVEDKLRDAIKLLKWESTNPGDIKHVTRKSRLELGKLSKKFSAILIRAARELWDNHEVDAGSVQKMITNDDTVHVPAGDKKKKRKKSRKNVPLKKRGRKNKKEVEEENDEDDGELFVAELQNTLTQTWQRRSETVSVIPIATPNLIALSTESKITTERLQKVVTKINNYVRDDMINSEMLRQCGVSAQYINQFCTEIIVRMQELQKPGALKMLKQRALTDLLAELKDIGIDYHIKPLSDSTTPEKVFIQAKATLSLFGEESVMTEKVQQLWKRSDEYYFRNIYMLQMLRLAFENEPSPDINAQKTKMRGYPDNLFFLQIRQRNAVIRVQEEQDTLASLLTNFESLRENLSSDAAIPAQQFVREWYLRVSSYVNRLAELVKQLHVLHQSLNQQRQTSTPYIKSLNDAKVIVLKAQEDLNKLFDTKTTSILLNATHAETVDKCIEQLTTVHTHLTTFEELSAKVAPKSTKLDLMLEIGKKLVEEYKQAKSERKSKKVNSKDFLAEFREVYESAVKSVQLAVQKLVKKNRDDAVEMQKVIEKNKQEERERAERRKLDQPEEEDEYEPSMAQLCKEGSVKRLDSYFAYVWQKLAQDINQLNEKLQSLIDKTVDHCRNQADETVMKQVAQFLVNMAPLIHVIQSIVDMQKLPFMTFHKSLAKLDYVIMSIFTTLFKQGYCGQDEEDGQGEGDGKGGTSFNDGTGMDEGEGMNDVTDQIENEDQIMNNKDTEKQEDQDLKENDDAVEIETDFEAKANDMDKRDSDDEEEPDEDMDKQMDDINEDDPNKETLDEQMWDDDEDDDDRDAENEDKKETRDDDMNADKKDKETELKSKDDGEEKNNKQNKQKPQEGNDEMAEEQEEIEQEEFQDVVEGEEEKGDGKDEQQDQKDTFNLPEELQLEDGLDEEEEEEEDNDAKSDDEDGEDEATESAPQPQHQDQKDDNIETEEIETENAEDKVDDDTMEDDKAEEEKDDEEKESLDPAVSEDKQALPAEDEDEEKKDTEGDAEEEDDKDKMAIDEQEAFEEDLKETPFGVKHTAGKSSDIKEDAAEDEEREEKQQNEAQEESGEDVNKNEFGESFDQPKENKQNQDREDKQDQADSAQFDPNPYRSLGDALKEWKEKIKMVEKEEKEKKTEEEANKEDDAYEFVNEDDADKDKQEQQVLATATEEQSEHFPDIEMEEEEEETKPEDEQNKPKDLPNDKKSEDKPQPENESMSNARFDKNQNKTNDDEEEDIVMEDDGFKYKENEFTAQENPDSTIGTNLEEQDIEQAEKRVELDEPMTMEDVQKMREELDLLMTEWRSDEKNVEQSKELWRRFDMITSGLAQELCEQLRLILEPTLATKLRGDYKTGKRINMKKVIPYIASQYRKDKIWLRRTKPNKRQYQIMLAIDDSKSMNDNHAGQMALESMTLICRAMSQLEVGQLSVVSFGEKMRLLHPFDRVWSEETGSEILSQFKFDQNQTQMAHFMSRSIHMMENYKSSLSSSGTENLQIAFIVSDGRMLDREEIVRMVRLAQEKKQLFVFILIDNPNPKDSILEVKSVTYPNNKLTVTNYIDQFPFPYYIILRDIRSLPEILADALRQWFELINMTSDVI
jgi:midasin